VEAETSRRLNLARGEKAMQDFIQNPLKGLQHDDFTGLPATFERLHTPNFEAMFIPQTGRLVLQFSDGQRRHLEQRDVESLRDFLSEHVKVQLTDQPMK
jgi:hypothetical protein